MPADLANRRASTQGVLASSDPAELRQLTKDCKHDLATEVFELVDKDRKGVANKQKLYDALVHGEVGVPQSKVRQLFETLDLRDTGSVTADEWRENFGRYIEEVSGEGHIGSPKLEGASERPRAPTFLPNGARGTKSERTLRGTGVPSGSKESGSAKDLRRSVQLSVSCAVESGSDSESRSSPSAMNGTRGSPKGTPSPKVASTGLTRRLSNVTPAAAGVGRPMGKQSERSVITKKGPKNTHFVVGHSGLNQRANHDAFKAKLIRRKSLKALLAVFSGISIRADGKVRRQEFEMYLRKNAPDLVQFARSIYKACAAKCENNKDLEEGDEELLDFPALLRVMYPGATKEDIKELIALSQPRDRAPQLDGKVEEAKELFDQYNWSANGWLTPQQFVDGMYIIGMTDDDVDQHLDELFPDTKVVKPVNFRDFFKWYSSGEDLPEKFADMSMENYQ
eukprot:jgi/Tetstr1/463062/TSEL_000708.t1